MIVSLNLIVCFSVLLNIVTCSPANFNKDEIKLKIHQGTLIGKESLDYWNGNFYSFEGIPYAKPPTGDLRFKKPEPAEPWTDVYDATQVRPICPQLIGEYGSADLKQSEDCLFLNVHTKMSTELKPVMVWIHGGGLEIGSIFENNYGPELLMREDIVLVKIAYRLGIFGFTSIEDSKYDIPGNAGLKDQVLALKWVQENIHHFGGDPNQVTIFGESAGGASVHLLYLSPLAKGLFHRAIVQSGAADNPWLTSPNKYPQLAETLGCNLENVNEIVNCINSTSTEGVLNAFNKMKENEDLNKNFRTGEIMNFNSITIESESNPNSFLSENCEDIVLNGKFNHVPIIMGFNTHEGASFIPSNPLKPNFIDYRSLIPKDIKIDFESKEAYELGKLIKEFYYGDQIPSYDVLDPYIAYTTDTLFLQQIYKYAKLQTNAAKNVPTYFYNFDLHTNLNLIKNTTNKYVTHFDDCQYLFYVKNQTPEFMDTKSEEYIGVHRMIKLWTTFATSKNADPNPLNDPLLNVKWLPIDGNKFNYLKISQELELKENPAEDRMKFWEEIYKQYN